MKEYFKGIGKVRYDISVRLRERTAGIDAAFVSMMDGV